MPKRAREEPYAQSTIERSIDVLLETYWWPGKIVSRMAYERIQDDCDGDRSQILEVGFSSDGDAWIRTYHHGSLRFRSEPGGGMSPRVRNAILLLAEAIRRDHDARPQFRQKPANVDTCGEPG
jgi:hypothetical protein